MLQRTPARRGCARQARSTPMPPIGGFACPHLGSVKGKEQCASCSCHVSHGRRMWSSAMTETLWDCSGAPVALKQVARSQCASAPSAFILGGRERGCLLTWLPPRGRRASVGLVALGAGGERLVEGSPPLRRSPLSGWPASGSAPLDIRECIAQAILAQGIEQASSQFATRARARGHTAFLELALCALAVVGRLATLDLRLDTLPAGGLGEVAGPRIAHRVGQYFSSHFRDKLFHIHCQLYLPQPQQLPLPPLAIVCFALPAGHQP